jgi:hypothetical protein
MRGLPVAVVHRVIGTAAPAVDGGDTLMTHMGTWAGAAEPALLATARRP